MSKELEALNELERFVNEYIGIECHRESGWHIADKQEFHLVKSALERKEKLERAIKDLFASHIELVTLDNCCYFKIKNSKGNERSYTSKTFEDFWKEVIK